jgi:hypothetical protein
MKTKKLIIGYDYEIKYEETMQNILILDYVEFGNKVLKDTRRLYEDNTYGSKYCGELTYVEVDDDFDKSRLLSEFDVSEEEI